jgi:hypothetical protein
MTLDRHPLGRRLALLAALTTLCAAAHAQSDDWQHVAADCKPATFSALQLGQFDAARGLIRAPMGAGNPKLQYTCNVLDRYDGFLPFWTTMELQAFDPVGGSVVATLYGKSKATGVSVALLNVSSPAAGVVTNTPVALPALDFSANAYHVVLTLTPRANVQPSAHMLKMFQ